MIATMLLALAGQAEAPATAVIPFAPPPGRELVERIIQARDQGGLQARFTIWRGHRFDPLPDGGWRMTSRVLAIDSAGPALARTGFRIGSEPMIGIALISTIDRDGRIVRLENGEDYWRAFREGQRLLAAEMSTRAGPNSVDRRIIAAVIAGIVADDMRDARLTAEIEPVIAHAGRAATVGARAAFDNAGPGGATGALRVTGVEPHVVRLALTSRTSDNSLAAVSVDADIAVERTTGLLRDRDERRRIDHADAIISLLEQRRLRDCGIPIPAGKPAESLDFGACFDE